MKIIIALQYYTWKFKDFLVNKLSYKHLSVIEYQTGAVWTSSLLINVVSVSVIFPKHTYYLYIDQDI